MWWLFLPFLLLIFSRCTVSDYPFKEGDLIFQDAQSSQCMAIELATGSQYTHVGLLFQENGTWVVYEAVQPVKVTPLEKFKKRGQNEHFVVKRSKDSVPVSLLKTYCEKELGKNYDIYFNWDNKEIYCSELAWKAYRNAGSTLCQTRPLSDYQLTHPIVLDIMKQRYGENIPWDEQMVAPSDLFSSPLLETIYSN